MATDVALPPGFELDSQQSSGPPLPAGFSLDQMPSTKAPEPAQASSTLERIGSGMADPIWGAGQMIAHALPKGLVDTGIVDQMVKDREAQYEANRAAAGSTGFDVARLAGNVASPVSLAMGGIGGSAAQLAGRGLLSRVIGGAAAGGNAAALAPVVDDKGDFLKAKLEQSREGGLIGAAIPFAGAAAARIIKPQTSEAAQELISKGITPTIGQILGGSAKSIEDKLMSLPVVGDVIGHARRGSVEDLNRTLYNMALEPIGQKSSAQIGRKGVNEVERKLSDAYDSLLSGRKIKLDQQFSQDISNIINASSIMTTEGRKQFMNTIRNKVLKGASPAGEIDGKMWKAIDSDLGKYARDFLRSQTAGERNVGDALLLAKDALRSVANRSNPDLQQKLAPIDQGWSMYARIRDASSRTGSKEGVVLPSTLDSAVRKLDMSVGKGGTAKGTAPMRAFSDQVNQVMGGNYPDSGTTGRAILNLLLLGGGMHINPASVMFGAAATVPYLPGVRKATAAALTQRPEAAGAVANATRMGAQVVAPGVAIEEAR